MTTCGWCQSPRSLKLMIDRMVCADGDNPDPNATHGKKPAEASTLELKDLDCPKPLFRCVYGLMVVHGDVAGIVGLRCGLSDAGSKCRLDRYIGYYEPYATSHGTLDAGCWMLDADVASNVIRAGSQPADELPAGKLPWAGRALQLPQAKVDRSAPPALM